MPFLVQYRVRLELETAAHLREAMLPATTTVSSGVVTNTKSEAKEEVRMKNICNGSDNAGAQREG